MPDIQDRSEKEKAYANLVAKLLRTYGGNILEVLGDPPDLANIPDDFWDTEAARWMEALVPFGSKVYLDSARQLLETIPIGIDWALINERAVTWASSYTFELVGGINDTTRTALQSAISSFFEEPITRGDLEERISPLFGPERAEMIAVTEVTRAASEGEQAVAKELAKEGIEMIAVWQTDNDELVCPLCEPRNEQPQEKWDTDEFPPLHPRCRCWVNYELPEIEQ